MSDIVLAALSGSLATITVMLAAARLAPRRRTAMAFARWSSLAPGRSALILAALGLVAVAPLTSVETEAVGEQNAAVASLDTLQLIASAPAATNSERVTADDDAGSDAGSSAAGREHALGALRNFTKKIEAKRQDIAAIGSDTGDAKPELPDVDTMTARLAERLKSAPNDAAGWRTLGWAYASTGKYLLAIPAYETALKLDPESAELKAALDSARSHAQATETAPDASGSNTQ